VRVGQVEDILGGVFGGGGGVGKLARFLVEDENVYERVEVDPLMAERVTVVRSVLKTLLGKVPFFMREEEAMFERVRTIVVANYPAGAYRNVGYSIRLLQEIVGYQFDQREAQFVGLVAMNLQENGTMGEFMTALKEFKY
jgi:hypothetical protein